MTHSADIALLRRLPPKRQQPTILGQLKFALVHEPLTWWKQGVRYRLRGLVAKGKIVNAIESGQLTAPQSTTDASGLRVNYLIGKRYTHLGILSAYSLRSNVDASCEIFFFDDGSLCASERSAIERFVPGSRVVPLVDWLSGSILREPHHLAVLHLLPERYPHILKLLLHSYLRNYSIVCDCDVLFLARCTALSSLAKARMPFFLEDKAEFYGLTEEQKKALATSPADKVNAGFYALDSEAIDFLMLDRLCLNVLELYGFSYLLEQFLTAVVLAAQAASPLPPTFAMAAYENHEAGPPELLHFANCLPALFIEASKRFL